MPFLISSDTEKRQHKTAVRKRTAQAIKKDQLIIVNIFGFEYIGVKEIFKRYFESATDIVNRSKITRVANCMDYVVERRTRYAAYARKFVHVVIVLVQKLNQLVP